MEKQDGRKLGKTALEERRRIIVRMKENGSSPTEIAAATGCSRQTIYPLWNKWKKRGKYIGNYMREVSTRKILRSLWNGC
jgi:DNA invertase Pin-like site-specific DNA recombinase